MPLFSLLFTQDADGFAHVIKIYNSSSFNDLLQTKYFIITISYFTKTLFGLKPKLVTDRKTAIKYARVRQVSLNLKQNICNLNLKSVFALCIHSHMLEI